jgi:hypothetical protein
MITFPKPGLFSVGLTAKPPAQPHDEALGIVVILLGNLAAPHTQLGIDISFFFVAVTDDFTAGTDPLVKWQVLFAAAEVPILYPLSHDEFHGVKKQLQGNNAALGTGKRSRQTPAGKDPGVVDCCRFASQIPGKDIVIVQFFDPVDQADAEGTDNRLAQVSEKNGGLGMLAQRALMDEFAVGIGIGDASAHIVVVSQTVHHLHFSGMLEASNLETLPKVIGKHVDRV